MRFADLKHLTLDKPQESINEELQRIEQEEEDEYTYKADMQELD